MLYAYNRNKGWMVKLIMSVTKLNCYQNVSGIDLPGKKIQAN